MENQRKTITFGPVGKYDNLNPQVEPVRCKYADMVAMRDEGKLIPGQLYRITDYVTTVNEFMEPNARSAGHQFDIIVLALDSTTLSEDAMAARHDGDEYFANSRLEAWELKYRLDNVQWSKVKTTYVEAFERGYVFTVDGTEEFDGTLYYRLKGDSQFQEDYAEYAYAESLEVGSQISYYDEYEHTLFGIDEIESVSVVPEDGKGTITYMKDEFDNVCHYDFKNIQFKRWKVTDTVEGRNGLNGLYLSADPDLHIEGLSVEDYDDFIWAYTFSSLSEGGEQDDNSLGWSEVYENYIGTFAQDLPNNVMYGSYNSQNKFDSCRGNTLAGSAGGNVLMSYCQYNVFGYSAADNILREECSYNSFGPYASSNLLGGSCQFNVVGSSFIRNTLRKACQNNTFGNNVRTVTLGDGCVGNVIANGVQFITYDAGVYFTEIESQGAIGLRYCCVLAGVKGASDNILLLPFELQKNYTQVAAMNSSGQLKIFVPGDLVQ